MVDSPASGVSTTIGSTLNRLHMRSYTPVFDCTRAVFLNDKFCEIIFTFYVHGYITKFSSKMPMKRQHRSMNIGQNKVRKIALWCINPNDAFRGQPAYFRISLADEKEGCWNDQTDPDHQIVNKITEEGGSNRKQRNLPCTSTTLLPHRFRIVSADPPTHNKKYGPTLVKCAYCSFYEANHKLLSKHICQEHPYRCASCKVDFSEKLEKIIHQIHKHKNEQHICEVCARIFDSQRRYELHSRGRPHKATLDIQWRVVDALLREVFQLYLPSREDLTGPDALSALRCVFSKPNVCRIHHKNPILEEVHQFLINIQLKHVREKQVREEVNEISKSQEITKSFNCLENHFEENSLLTSGRKSVAIVNPMHGVHEEVCNFEETFMLEEESKSACRQENCVEIQTYTKELVEVVDFEWEEQQLVRPLTPKTPRIGGTIHTPVIGTLYSPFHMPTLCCTSKLLTTAKQNALFYNHLSGIDSHVIEFEDLWQQTALQTFCYC